MKGSIRRNQIITTYGVGAMIPVEEESVMVAGLDAWPAGQPDIHEPRLERQLHVRGFLLPPASGDKKRWDIPVVRFPTQYSCPTCKRLAPHRFFSGPNENKCNQCRVEFIPSRFVTVRPAGDWAVLHSVGLTGHDCKPWAEIDFVLIGPPGIFCLEVKGGRVSRRADAGTLPTAPGMFRSKMKGRSSRWPWLRPNCASTSSLPIRH
jgi:hypothetical protein